MHRVSQRKFTRLAGCEMQIMRPIFKTEMFIYQSKANVDEKILCGEITYHLDPEIRKLLVNCNFGNDDSTFHPGL